MSELLERFDSWLSDSGPAALTLREHLMPVEGHDGVVFPATYAASEDRTFKGGYNIDQFPDGTNICLIDSVGSQANRIEPIFGTPKYSELVPQVTITAGDKKVSLLEAGHRAADAIVRSSALRDDLRAAFRSVQNGNAEPLAKIAPTSLVFGAWDSRDTQAKLPRVISSTVRAFNVRELTRSAQFVPATEYVENGLLDEAADEKTRKSYAERGFTHVPASASHGGVVASGGIRRDAALHLAALRLLAAGEEKARTLTLQRYVFGLALTAFTYTAVGYYRQGCNLVLDPDKPRELRTVFGDGRRETFDVTHAFAFEYAQAAAVAFDVGPARTVPFEKELAIMDLKGEIANDSKKEQRASPKKNKRGE